MQVIDHRGSFLFSLEVATRPRFRGAFYYYRYPDDGLAFQISLAPLFHIVFVSRKSVLLGEG